MKTAGFDDSNDSINLWPKRWAEGFTIFGFDLTPDKSAGKAVVPMETGQLDLSIQFDTALAEVVTVLMCCEWDEVVENSKHREVTYVPIHG